MKRVCFVAVVGLLVITSIRAQTINGSLSGRVTDSTGGVLPGAAVTALNSETGFSKSALSSDSGQFSIPSLPPGVYSVTAELTGFKKQVKTHVALQVGQAAVLDFELELGEISESVFVESNSAALELEPTRTQQSSVIDQVQIDSLPVNGRQFIDFALLAPGVTIGETTSGSTDVIIEPVTKLAFAGQNIHFNFIAVDGADNISTASGVQRSSPSQEAVREFRVINSNFESNFGRAVGGIVNIITQSGSNQFHGSVYDFLRNDALDASSILASPDPDNPSKKLDELRQNQFGVTLGGPIVRDRSFFFLNYEGQRRGESPFFNSAALQNIDAINQAKVNFYGLPAENLSVLRTRDTDTFLGRVDHQISERSNLFLRYSLDDQRAENLSPLNDGFDLPSAFKNNFLRDQSLVGNLITTFSSKFVNELRGQYARRSFDFSTVTTQPALEVINLFKSGVNRGNPDFYRETRIEFVDSVTAVTGDHTISFGGNYNFVRTTEAFPLFIPFEAQFVTPQDYINGNPVVFFFQRFNPSSPTFPTSLFSGQRFGQDILDATVGTLDHTYNGLFVQDKWQATTKLTLNFGVRWDFETWPSGVLNTDWNNIDPRFGFAYNFGTRRRVVLRGGAGIFHGIIPSPLLLSQPSIGGTGPLPGRENVENELNGSSPIFVFAATPDINQQVLQGLLNGVYPPGGEFAVVRFARDHQVPYGIQGTLSLGFEVLPDTSMQISYLATRGVHLGSFFNANQLLQPTGTLESGKDDFAAVRFNRFASIPSFREPEFTLYFEADSRWNSIYHGLLVNLNRRYRKYVGWGLSYTWSKTIDDGPNPSFVLIPENANRFDLERAVSSDDLRHRFVLNATVGTPAEAAALLRNWRFSGIVTLHSPHHFTKFAGFDANGDGFPVNDRVGLDSRNTFEGDTMKTVDIRVSRSFKAGERAAVEVLGEAFNVFNTLNVRFNNTVYGDSVFNAPGTPGTFLEGAPNPFFGSPRAIFNPRQIQFAIKITW